MNSGGATPNEGGFAVKRACRVGATCTAFGIGLLTATILPAKCVLVLVALALVLSGCSALKY